MPHGRDVFIHACQYLTEVCSDLLHRHQYSVENLAWFIPHQANFRISKNVAEQLGLPLDKVISNIHYLGNTGCAGCAIGLSENWDHLQQDDLVLMAVFGGGYSFGGMLLKK